MDRDVLRLLEFPTVKEIVKGFAVTEMGKLRIDAFRPSQDPVLLERALRATTEMKQALEQEFTVPLGGAHDVRPHARKAAAGGGPLDPAILFRIADCLEAADRVAKSLRTLSSYYTLLKELGRQMPHFPRLVQRIHKAVDSTARIRDGASAELKRIRARIRLLRQRIEHKLDELVHTPSVVTHLQFPGATLMRDRYVLPVNARDKGRIEGLVHGSSNSSATVYVEPLAIVSSGNELCEILGVQRDEERRILWELTRQVGAESESIIHAVELLGQVDSIRAKALMSSTYDLSEPELTADRTLDIRDARHPILLWLTTKQHTETPDFEAVVPISLHLGDDYDILVVTGPNMGGKTVTLKTVGLTCLMALTGMHVPASRATVPLYDNIFADIGDEQSLQQSLSTFSSHVSRIIRILGQTSPRSLVMLDELGAGTDPAEGGALGLAIIDRLLRIGSCAVVTTHLGRLKTFASATPRVENASVEFDPVTLEPTYHLRIGAPGLSNAIEIARRLGLPRELLDDARLRLTEETEGDHAPELDELREARREVEERRSRVHSIEREVAEQKREYDERLLRLRQEEERKDTDLGLRIRDELERLANSAGRLYDHVRFSHKTLAQQVRELRDGLTKTLEQISGLLRGHRPPRPIQPGDEVYVIRAHKWAEVERVDKKRQRAMVKVGDIQMDVSLDDLLPWGSDMEERLRR